MHDAALLLLLLVQIGFALDYQVDEKKEAASADVEAPAAPKK